jgi:predicted RNA-binding protein with PUA-like domain
MAYWLMKSEPSTYSIDDLARAKNQSGFWDGVRNYQARNFLRDEMKPGDLAFFYHSSCDVPGIVGIIKITETGCVDKTAFDPESPYFDPRSTPDNPRWYGVKFTLVEKFEDMIPLGILRINPILQHMPLLKKGNRLSITPVTQQEWLAIIGKSP